jgi:hypothetical protein
MPTINDVNGPLGSVEAADAERAIRRAILLYCKGIDTCDADTVMKAFHADATTDYGAAQGKAADFAKGATSKLREYAISTKHFPSDSLITFTSATNAVSTSRTSLVVTGTRSSAVMATGASCIVV